jgi:two-component system CheB/CheR fusion protein
MLNHRVRNLLSIVASVARRSGQSGTSAEEYAMHLGGRIDALARAHNALLHSPEGSVDLDVMLAEELMAHAAQEGEQVKLSGPRITLTGKAVETLWLAIHEMAVNAVKFGALSARGGRITIEWLHVQQDGAPTLDLHWRETMAGALVQGGPHRGFGAEVIERTLPYEVGGSARFAVTPEGADYRLEIPLSASITVATVNTGEG